MRDIFTFNLVVKGKKKTNGMKIKKEKEKYFQTYISILT